MFMDSPGDTLSPERRLPKRQNSTSPDFSSLAFDERPAKRQKALSRNIEGNVYHQEIHGDATLVQESKDDVNAIQLALQNQSGDVNIYGNVFNAANMTFNYQYNQHIDQEWRLHLRLQPCGRANYKYGLNSGEKKKLGRDLCTPGTRKQVMGDILDWAGDGVATTNNLFLLCGPAGSGKSTIAYTMTHLFDPTSANTLEIANQLGKGPGGQITLGASFFCSRQFDDTSRLSAIVPTIAYQLAIKFKPFADALRELDAVDHAVDIQLEKLLAQPWREATAANPRLFLVVIEAIDELPFEDSRSFFAGLLKLLKNDPPEGLKFLVTSREEGDIMELVGSLEQIRVYRLQDIEKTQVSADIHLYLEVSLGPKIAQTDIEAIVAFADGLFICAATIVRYLELYRKTPKTRERRLRKLLLDVQQSSFGLEALDELYTQILTEAFAGFAKDPDFLSDYISILHTFICTIIPADPYTAATLADTTADPENLECLAEIAPDALLRLHAVFYADNEGYVLSYHRSFPDFIFDQTRSGRFHCDHPVFSARLATSCLRHMEVLRFNIANIESSFSLDSDISDLPVKVKTNISPSLAYSCQYWSHHLSASGSTDANSLSSSLSRLLDIRALL